MILMNLAYWILFIFCYTVCNRLENKALFKTSIFDELDSDVDLCREDSHRTCKKKILWYKLDMYGVFKTLMIFFLLLTIITFNGKMIDESEYPTLSSIFIFIIYGGIWKFAHYTFFIGLRKSKEKLRNEYKQRQNSQRTIHINSGIHFRNDIRWADTIVRT